ncbi:MAG TPA: aldolase/citrate lyase family protein [Candidatus Sulfotelmatobacter sp.]|nr:aldolase/citrate lyase family protein [Candidatus Sulfotelmatobacter sp.]
MRANRVKRALLKGEVQVGTWVNALRTPQIAQMVATAGFDFMYIDMEHSAFSVETVGDLCYAALGAGLVPIVRPPAKEPHLLTRPLDNGAMGLLIPHVDTGEEAQAVAKAIRFPPLGERGMNLQGVHTGFGRASGDEYVKATHAETLLLVQIESDRGIQNLGQILSVEGVDGAVIGRADLSTDLGLPGQTNHPEVVKRVEAMIAACRQHGKIPGLLVQDVASAKEWIAKGIRLVPYANEVSIYITAASRAVSEIRAFAKEPR